MEVGIRCLEMFGPTRFGNECSPLVVFSLFVHRSSLATRGNGQQNQIHMGQGGYGMWKPNFRYAKEGLSTQQALGICAKDVNTGVIWVMEEP